MHYRFTEQAGTSSGALHPVKWKKPVSKGCIPWVTDMTVHQRQNLYGDEELIPGCRGEESGEDVTTVGQHVGFGGKWHNCSASWLWWWWWWFKSLHVKIHKAVYQKQPIYWVFFKKYRMRTLRNSTVESSRVSRHPSWPGPKCSLDGSCPGRGCAPKLCPLHGPVSLTDFFLPCVRLELEGASLGWSLTLSIPTSFSPPQWRERLGCKTLKATLSEFLPAQTPASE